MSALPDGRKSVGRASFAPNKRFRPTMLQQNAYLSRLALSFHTVDDILQWKLVVFSSQLLIINDTSITRDVSHFGACNEKVISSSYDRLSNGRRKTFDDRLTDRMPIGNL